MILTVVLRRLEHNLLPSWRNLQSAPAVPSATLVSCLQTSSPFAADFGDKQATGKTERAWGHVPLDKLSVLFGVH